MAWLDDVGGHHGLNLSFDFVFMEVLIQYWRTLIGFELGSMEMWWSKVCDRGKLVGFVKIF